MSVRSSIHLSTFTLGVLWAQFLLQYCTHLFETSHVFFVMVWGYAGGLYIIVRLFFVTFFHFVNWSHFLTSMYRQWIPCEHNSSFTFILIFLKLCTCFLYGLKMCMWFGYNTCFNFCHFFHFANFLISWPQILWKCIDSGYLVSPTLHTILYRSFWNFTRFLHGLENFCHFSTLLTLSFFAGVTSTSPKFDLYFFISSILSFLFWCLIFWEMTGQNCNIMVSAVITQW